MATQDSGGFKDDGFDFSNFLDEDDEIIEPEKEVQPDPTLASPAENSLSSAPVAVPVTAQPAPAAVEPAGFSPVDTELVGLLPEGKPVAKSPEEITTGGLDLDLREAYEGYLTGGKMSWGNKRQAKKHIEEALKLEDALRDADKAILARAGGYASIIANLSDEKLIQEEESFLKGDEEDYYADEEVETSDSALASRAAQIQSTDLYKELERLESHRSTINSKRITALEGLREATSNEDNKYWLGLNTAISDRLKGIADVQDVTKSKVSVEDEEIFEKGVEHFEGYLSGDFDPLSGSDEDEDAEFEPYQGGSEDGYSESEPNLGYLSQQEESYPEDETDGFPQWSPEPVAEETPLENIEDVPLEDQELNDGLETAESLFVPAASEFSGSAFFEEQDSEFEDAEIEAEAAEQVATSEDEFELLEPGPVLEADLSPENTEDESYGHEGPTLAESPFWDEPAAEEVEPEGDSSDDSADEDVVDSEEPDEDFEADPWSEEEPQDEAPVDFESDPWGQEEDSYADEDSANEADGEIISEFTPVEASGVRERFDEQNSFVLPVEPDREPVRAVIFEELKAKHKIDFD